MVSNTKSGFTLIELLVVIAIIAILAAILFPVFAAAKERAINSKCLNNEKQLAFAFRAYTVDNNGRMPKLRPRYVATDPPDWCGAIYPVSCDPRIGSLWPYTKNLAIYLCSTDARLPAKNVNGQPKNYPLSYSANAEMDRMNVDTASNRRQSRILLLIHESRKTINDGYLYWRNALGANPDDMPSDVHYKGSNVCFADCHASYLSYNELMDRCRSGEWDPERYKSAP